MQTPHVCSVGASPLHQISPLWAVAQRPPPHLVGISAYSHGESTQSGCFVRSQMRSLKRNFQRWLSNTSVVFSSPQVALALPSCCWLLMGPWVCCVVGGPQSCYAVSGFRSSPSLGVPRCGSGALGWANQGDHHAHTMVQGGVGACLCCLGLAFPLACPFTCPNLYTFPRFQQEQ